METPPRDVAELTARIAAGLNPRFLFFWGHTPKQPGVVGQECLSQWFPASFELEGEHFRTAEHYMMWSKARLFGDEAMAREVLAAATPAEAKKFGRAVSHFDEHVWRQQRFEIVTRASVAKFSQNPELGAFLRGTGNRVLVEASPRDCIWGIGLGAKNERAQDPAQWRGLNLLGFALMQARAKL
jgi:ribA/ribD-fused uncharacterized protein